MAVLRFWRLMLVSLCERSDYSGLASTTYLPTGRPEFFTLGMNRDMGTRLTIAAPNSEGFPIIMSLDGVQTQGTGNWPSLYDSYKLLIHEISEVQKGVRLGTKAISDSRSERLLQKPLWRGMPDYEKSGPFHKDFLSFNLRNNEMSFWRHWQRGLIDGKKIDSDLQKRIVALRNQEWDKGVTHIAKEIEKIQASILSEKMPLAEIIEINTETGKFHSIPTPVQNIPLLGTVLSTIRDALDDAVQGNNGLNSRSYEVRVLTRAIERFGNDPQRIEMDLTSVAISLRRQINETKELADSADNLGVLRAVEEGALGVRATHPDVAENRLTLAKQALRELTRNQKQQLLDAVPLLEAISEGNIAEDFANDIPVLVNDAIGPPGDFGPRLPGIDRTIRTFSRSAKMAIIWQKIIDSGAELHDSKGHKTAKLGLTVTGVGAGLYAIVRVGLKVLGVL